MRYSQRLRKVASNLGQRLANIRWRREKAARLLNPPDVDADTLRSRALSDRKGSEIWSGLVTVRHSTSRTNQYDVLIDGAIVYTGGAARMGEAIVGHKKPCLQICAQGYKLTT